MVSAAALGVGLLVSACGSSGSSASQSGSSASSSGSGTSAPIGVSIVGPFKPPPGGTLSFPETQATAEAAVKSINASGGIHGRKLVLTACDDMFLPADDTSCFQSITANKSIVAETGGYLLNADTIAPIVNTAKLPIIGDLAASVSAQKDPNWVEFGAGQTNVMYGVGADLAQHGAKSIAVLVEEGPSAGPNSSSIKAGAQKYGGMVKGTVEITRETVDLSSAVAKLLALHPQGIALIVGGLQVASAEKLLSSSGYTGYTVVDPDINGPKDIKSFAAPGVRELGVSSLPPATDTSTPEIKQFNAALTKYAPGTTQSGVALDTWISFHVLAQALDAIHGPITRATTENALNHLNTFETEGATRPVKTGFTEPGPDKSSPRTVDTWIVDDSLKGGVMTWDHTFHPGYSG